METIKCKECGKELSSKAEICPSCGVRVKPKKLIIRIYNVLNVLTVIGATLFAIVFVLLYAKELGTKAKRTKYLGTWTLSSSSDVISYNESFGSGFINLKDISLTREYASFGTMSPRGCDINETTGECDYKYEPSLLLTYKGKIMAISFVNTNGEGLFICFKASDRNTLKQVPCNEDKYGEFTESNCLNNNYNIVYKKK